MVFNTGPYTDLPDNSILITANMQSETGFPSSHQLTLSPRKEDNPAFWYLFYSPKADIPALLNMPNTPKADISACPSRAYDRMACISAGELRVN